MGKGAGGPQLGRVVQTLGRRVLVRTETGEEHVCFLSGRRAVVGDRVRWQPVAGGGGKLLKVLDRATVLRRTDNRGREQILAANLHGIVVVAAPVTPTFSSSLLDRYLVAAHADGLGLVVCLNKIDLGVPESVEAELALRSVDVVRVSAHTGEGLEALAAVLARGDGPWALVGHSGVGKTSLLARLLPDEDVGPVGEISDYWGTGRHTTSSSRLFQVGDAEIADSPGIRNFTPGGLETATVRDHFPGIAGLPCKFRDCLHRPGEDGCAAEDQVHPALLESYRRLLDDVSEAERGRQPW